MSSCLRTSSLFWIAAGALCASSVAQDLPVREFPLDVVAFRAREAEIELAPRRGDIAALAALDAVRFDAVALPDGSFADLELERIDLGRLELGLRLDDRPAMHLLDAAALSVWMGHVVGAPDSEVALSFSRYGCRGWVSRAGELYHLTAASGDLPDWSQCSARWYTEESIGSRGGRLQDFCATDSLPNTWPGPWPPTPQTGSGIQPAMSNALYKCRMSIETDYQMFQVFGNATAEASFVTTLLAWISYRYEEQIGTVLIYPYVGFYSTPNDPWVSGDNNAGSTAMLFEFKNAWAGAIPGTGKLALFLSGANLGGGVAFLPGLCAPPNNFAVVGNMGGATPFPVQPYHPANWDFYASAHEVGHNFGAAHTQDYCPPLDECPPTNYFGACQTQQVCTNQGTIMSYCHLCQGGMTNITTYFHPASVLDMRHRVETTCLPLYCVTPTTYCVPKVNSLGCSPLISYTGNPTLSGLDDFHVRATNVIDHKSGLMYWSFLPLNAPFQGGTKCVGSPSTRTPLQDSGGGAAGTCTGSYDYFMTHAYMSSHAIIGGLTLYCQYWMRDPASPSTTGLSGGLKAPVCN